MSVTKRNVPRKEQNKVCLSCATNCGNPQLKFVELVLCPNYTPKKKRTSKPRN